MYKITNLKTTYSFRYNSYINIQCNELIFILLYAKLMKAYGGALIVINDWKKKHLTESFSHYVTVADEAFLWLCLDTYLPIYNPTDVDCINPTDGHILMVSNKDTGVSKNSATPLTPTGNDGITQKHPKHHLRQTATDTVGQRTAY